MLAKLLCFGQHPQLVIPIGLERVGHQPIVGIHPQITPTCQFGFITGSLHLLLAQPVGFLQTRLQFLLNGKCDFQCHRGDGLHQKIADRLVDVGTGNVLADRFAVLDALALANVVGHQLPARL